MKINKKKFIVRTLELLIIIATIILTPIAIIYANKARNYYALGGEYMIPIIALLIIMIIEEIYKESEESRAKVKIRRNKRCPRCRKKTWKIFIIK